jgi:hypothetical protein
LKNFYVSLLKEFESSVKLKGVEEMKNNELKELNEFLLNKNKNENELQKIAKNSKFQLLIDRILEIEQLKKGLLEIEINEKENIDDLEYLNELLTSNLENYKNLKKIVSNKRYKEIVLFIIKISKKLKD